jgi:hypothetical protein
MQRINRVEDDDGDAEENQRNQGDIESPPSRRSGAKNNHF